MGDVAELDLRVAQWRHSSSRGAPPVSCAPPAVPHPGAPAAGFTEPPQWIRSGPAFAPRSAVRLRPARILETFVAVSALSLAPRDRRLDERAGRRTDRNPPLTGANVDLRLATLEIHPYRQLGHQPCYNLSFEARLDLGAGGEPLQPTMFRKSCEQRLTADMAGGLWGKRPRRCRRLSLVGGNRTTVFETGRK